MNIIIDYNRTIFDPMTGALYPGAYEVLEKASKQHVLFLVSRQMAGRQETVSGFGIQKFFREVFFMSEKTEALFQMLGEGAENVMVVGDSIQDEIRIGNALGYITVRIRQGLFSEKIADTEAERAVHEIESIKELEKIIAIYET